jgi:hypothetical protein
VGAIAGIDTAQAQIVRAELGLVLESASFRTSKRCREFLEYIVAHTITGPSGALKERSIGVDLFQLPRHFDTGQHTIVRVTANEVRKRLAQYYMAENGTRHAVRIELPPGSYSAEFRWDVQPAEPPLADALPQVEIVEAGPQAPTAPGWMRYRVIAASAAVLLIAGALGFWRWQTAAPAAVDAKSAVARGGFAALAPAGPELRFMVGSTNPYVDRSGRTWGPDRFFSGGNVLVHPAERILRTLDPDIYRRLRSGDFRYDIPLDRGTYELHLHFAETGLSDFISAESSGEGQRVFTVRANGKPLLEFFDAVADAAGANMADERVFRDISPADDGALHLAFSPLRGNAMVSAVELLPVGAGKARPVRLRAGWTSSWQDPAGQQWQADSYFLGGNALARTTNPAQEGNSIAPDIALYASERWGHFTYAVPVADGRYRVNLKFCEGHYGQRNTGVGGLGSRLFDVYCNGVALLRNFDIFKEAGGEGKPLTKAFPGIRPNAQGKIVLSFVPVKGMACVNGIEVVEE